MPDRVFHVVTATSGELFRLGALVEDRAPRRRSGEQFTVFDSSGISLQDLYMADALIKAKSSRGAIGKHAGAPLGLPAASKPIANAAEHRCLASHLHERALEGSKEEIDVLGPTNQRRAHLECILIGPCGADQDAIVAHRVDHIQSHGTSPCRRRALRPHIDPDKQTGISDCTDRIMPL